MSTKSVLVHHCADAIRLSRKPGICACIRKVDHMEAVRMIARGEAKFMIWTARNGKDFRDEYNIAETEKTGRPPIAQTISDGHIQSAYIEGEQYHQDRIVAYGNMTQDLFFELGATSRLVAEYSRPATVLQSAT